ncbi:MAG TPA: hypothetical protein VKN18_03695 [Blastocatellia bacterium]|nr:hypothetical protein [Blastocatellia bacterium]
MKPRVIFNLFLTLILLFTMSVPGLSQPKKKGTNDVALELIGQVINPSAASSIQFGYLNYVNGIATPIFSGSPQNETTALLTFYSDTVTTGVINNGPMRVIDRTGTFTIYFDSTPEGDFSNPDSFRDGMPVMVASLRHQVILDTVTGSFTTTFSLTLTSVDFFRLGNENIHLATVGDTLVLTVIGHLNTPAPPAAHIAGFVVGGDLTRW